MESIPYFNISLNTLKDKTYTSPLIDPSPINTFTNIVAKRLTEFINGRMV